MKSNHPFWEKFYARFRKDKIAQVAGWLFFAFIIAAVFAGALSPNDPYDPLQIDLMDAETPPRWQDAGDERFLLGTDPQGRDLLSTMLHGLRISIIIGVFAVLLQSFLGISIGLIAGYTGGRVDAILMRFADIQLSFSSFMNPPARVKRYSSPMPGVGDSFVIKKPFPSSAISVLFAVP